MSERRGNSSSGRDSGRSSGRPGGRSSGPGSRGGSARSGGRSGGSGGFRSGSGRPSGPRRDDDRPARSRRDDGDGPRRNFRDDGDRPGRSFRDGDGSRGRGPRRDDDRPARSRRDDGDRPRRSFRDDGDRPRRSFRDGDAPRGRGPRRDDDRPARPRRDDGDRPRRSFRDDGDRPRRDFRDGDGPRGRGPRRDDDRPARSRRDDGDRPRRSFRDDDRAPRFEEREPRNEAERRSAEVRRRTGGRRTNLEPSGPPERTEEIWIDEGSTRRRRNQSGVRSKGTGKSQKGGRKEVRALDTVVGEFEDALGTRAAGRAIRRYEAALQAFEAFRYDEARKILTPMAKEYSDVSAVHEMLGLCLYRGGQWKKAAAEIECALELNPTWIFNHAVLADCHRALGNHARVKELWREVSEASPAPELMAEARIVFAGSLADQGHVEEALSTLARQAEDTKRPQEYHLRQWYVIGDLHDRAGNVIEARRFFERIVMHEAGFADVVERLASLGG